MLLYPVGAEWGPFCLDQEGWSQISPLDLQLLAASGAHVAAWARWLRTRKLAAAPVRAPGARFHKTCAALASFIASSWVMLLPCVVVTSRCAKENRVDFVQESIFVLFSVRRVIFPASAKKRNSGNMVWLLLPSQVAFASIRTVLIAGRFHYWWLCSARGNLYHPPELFIPVIKHQVHSTLSLSHPPFLSPAASQSTPETIPCLASSLQFNTKWIFSQSLSI